MDQVHLQKKDLGTQRMVMDALPYKVVGSTYDGSFQTPVLLNAFRIALNHIVPAGKQLKIMFLRVSAGEASQWAIRQSNPTAIGQTGAVEAFPVVGSVPSGFRDRIRLTAANVPLTDRGQFAQPVHVLEGSIDFMIMGPTPVQVSGNRYTLAWWGVQQDMDP